jgi:hypothetical protein
MRTAKLSASLFVLLASGAIARPAHSETLTCTAITTLPAIITQQGIYCLTGNLITSMVVGNAIDIQANSVMLDLNGFKLGGQGGLGTNAFGIYALNRKNITVKNGTVRGFADGIVMEMNGGVSQGHVVEDIRAEANTFVGINVQGSGNIVRNNQIVSTGGSTVFGADASAFGIYVTGSGPRVLNNDVIDTTKQGNGYSAGILLTQVSGALAVNNRITQAEKGVFFLTGTGKYRDNLTFGVPSPVSGGTDAGNNN